MSRCTCNTLRCESAKSFNVAFCGPYNPPTPEAMRNKMLDITEISSLQPFFYAVPCGMKHAKFVNTDNPSKQYERLTERSRVEEGSAVIRHAERRSRLRSQQLLKCLEPSG